MNKGENPQSKNLNLGRVAGPGVGGKGKEGGSCKVAHVAQRGMPTRAGLGLPSPRLCLARLSGGGSGGIEGRGSGEESCLLAGNRAVGKNPPRVWCPLASLASSCWLLMQVAALLTQVMASSQQPHEHGSCSRRMRCGSREKCKESKDWLLRIARKPV